MVKSAGRSTTGHHRKRYGHHQQRNKPFLKTYLPYLPLLTILLTGTFFGLRNQPQRQHDGVLAYATNVSANTLLQETNLERTANGDPVLRLNDKLALAAQAKASDMAKRNYWSHITPDGKQPWVFLDEAGYDYQKAGENLAYGFSSSKDTVAGWMNSPSHKANLLDKDFTEVGFGYANASSYQAAGASTVVVALYARGQTASLPTTIATSSSPNQAVRGDATTVANLANAHTYRIARIQIITNGAAPWSIWAILALAFIGIAYITIKHSLSLRRTILKGERFVLTHPLFDVTLVAFIALCVFVSRAEGYILSASFTR